MGCRSILWAAVLLVLVRGTGEVLDIGAGDAKSRRGEPHRGSTVGAFAVTVARAYLSGGRTADRYFPRSATPTEEGPRGSGVDVAAATVAGEEGLTGRRWLVTVGCELADGGGTRYLAVPVQRDGRGALAMFALPAVVPGPDVRRVDADETSPISGRSAPAIERLVERFLAGYLAGGGLEKLSYLTAPGADLQAAGGFELLAVERVGVASEQVGRRLVVAAEVRARDRATGARYPLAYRLELVRRDRWCVAGVQGALS